MAHRASIAVLLALVVVAANGQGITVTKPCLSWTDCTEACGGGQRTCQRQPNGKDYKIDCYMQSCDQEDTCGKADILFVLDSSGSLGPKNWWKTKQFAIDLSRGLKISETDSRVAMVAFSTNPVVTFQFGDHNDHDSVEEAIWAAPWISKSTNTMGALYAARDVFNTSGRPGVKHIIVLVTDGISNRGKDKTIPAAEEVQAEGIEIFCLGIGRVDETEIRGIASQMKDEHAFLVEAFDGLTAITSSVTNSTCIAANRSECDEWGPWGEECVLDDPDKNCGPGQNLRTRECRFYLYEGSVPTVREDVEGKPCDGPQCLCAWSECDVACGGGIQTCDVRPEETQPCNPDPCPTTTTTEETTTTFLPTGESTTATEGEECVCRVRGDPLVLQFDGELLSFHESGKYTLVRSVDQADGECGFSLSIQVSGKNSGLTYPEYIEMGMVNRLIRLAEGGILTVDTEDVGVPQGPNSVQLDQGALLKAYTSGEATVVESTQCGLQVSFSGAGADAEAAVVVSTTKIDVAWLDGLCGNCDGVGDITVVEAYLESEEV